MPIQVQGPDGQLLEFPDGTPEATMKAAMQKRYGGPASAPKPSENDKRKAFYHGFSPVAQFLGGSLDALQHHVGNIPTAIAQAGANTGDWIGEKLGIPKSADNFADRMNAGV